MQSFRCFGGCHRDIIISPRRPQHAGRWRCGVDARSGQPSAAPLRLPLPLPISSRLKSLKPLSLLPQPDLPSALNT